MEQNEFVVIDVTGIPKGLNIEVWISLKQQGLILWDSSNYVDKLPYEPKVYNAERTYRTIDISMLSEDERNELLKSIEK